MDGCGMERMKNLKNREELYLLPFLEISN